MKTVFSERHRLQAGWAELIDGRLLPCYRQIGDYQPDALVVSLGVDTFKDDPIACFGLESDDFLAVGARIARFGLPTLSVMEGGYAIAALGINPVNLLSGFEQAA